MDPFQRHAHQVPHAVGHPADGERPAHVAAVAHVPRAEGELRAELHRGVMRRLVERHRLWWVFGPEQTQIG